MSGYGSFASHLPSVLFLMGGLVFMFVSMWRSERTSRRAPAGRAYSTTPGARRDGRRGLSAPTRHPVSRAASSTATTDTRDGRPRS